MAYNANTNWNNERSYLNSLISKGGGNAEWAKKQMNELNRAQQQYSGSSGSSGGGTTRTPSASTPSRSSGNSYTPASGGAPVRTPNTPSTPSTPAASGGYGANTNWANENSYLNGLISKGGGQAEWAKKQLQTLQEAQKKYTGSVGGGAGSLDDAELRNRYFPGADVIPSGVDLAAGTTRAPNGDILPLHDWSTDTTDYGQLMLNAKDINEFREAAQARVNKARAQGIDISGKNGTLTNEDLYLEWKKKSGYNPGYGDFMYKGWGWDSIENKEGYIDNAGQGTGYYGMDGEGHWGYYEDPGLTKKLAKGAWDDYASSDGGYVRMDDTGQPDMTQRDMSRAGQTVILTSPRGTWECTYSDNGYITRRLRTSSRYTYGLIPAKADNDAGVSSEDLLYLDTGHRYAGPGSDLYNQNIRAASREDYDKVMEWRRQNGLDTGSSGPDAGMGGKLPNASGVNGDLSGLLSDALSGGVSGSGSTGGTSGGGSGYDLSEWLKKQYASALEGELAGLKDAYEKNNAGLEDEEARLSGIYDPQRNRIAAQNALEKRVWDERAAANGLSSGANGQAELARSSTMQRDLASIGEEEANARADVSLRKKNLTIEYTNAITQARANGQAELAKALYNELVRVQGLEREDQIRESENALKQAQAKMEYDLALKQMEADSAAASQTTAKPSLTASQAYTAYKNGIRTDEVMTAMQYYYGIGGNSSGGSGGTSGASGGTYSGGTSGKTGTTTTTPSKVTTTGKVSYDNGGLTSAQIKQLQQDMNKYLPTGQKIAVDGYWGPATKAAAGGATAKDYYYAWLNQQQKNSGLVNKQERT